MRLLIVGASGFLGAHVRGQAADADIEVVTASRAGGTGQAWRHVRIDLAHDDPTEIAAMIAAVAPDAVVNCSGATAGPAGTMAEVNVTGTFSLARAMLAYGRSTLVHLGSAAEYGSGVPGEPVTERTPPQPAALYGATKLAGTRIVELAASAGLAAVVLRVFNPVGAGAPATSLPGRLAAELRRAITGNDDVRVGPLDAVRDFVDARDVADAVLAAAAAPALPHQVVNVGSGHGVPARTLVKLLVAISGYRGQVREDATASGRSGAVAWQQADVCRAARDLGWAPRRSLESSLTDLWEATS